MPKKVIFLLGVLILTLGLTTAYIANPDTNFTIISEAKKKTKEASGKYQQWVDSKIRKKEKQGDCKGKYCLANEVLEKADRNETLTPEEQEIVDKFNEAIQQAVTGNSEPIEKLKSLNANLAKMAEERAKKAAEERTKKAAERAQQAQQLAESRAEARTNQFTTLQDATGLEPNNQASTNPQTPTQPGSSLPTYTPIPPPKDPQNYYPSPTPAINNNYPLRRDLREPLEAKKLDFTLNQARQAKDQITNEGENISYKPFPIKVPTETGKEKTVYIELGIRAEEIETQSIGQNTSAFSRKVKTVNCGGLNQPPCKLRTACNKNLSLDSNGLCIADQYYTNLAVSQLIANNNNQLDSKAIYSLALINNVTQLRPEFFTNKQDAACAYSPANQKIECYNADDQNFVSQFNRIAQTLETAKLQDPQTGGLNQPCGKTWFLGAANKCSNELLACDEKTNTCKPTEPVKQVIARTIADPQNIATDINNAIITPYAETITNNSIFNQAGCVSDYSSYHSNGGCFICLNAKTKTIQRVSNDLCNNPQKLAQLVPGAKCAQEGGICSKGKNGELGTNGCLDGETCYKKPTSQSDKGGLNQPCYKTTSLSGGKPHKKSASQCLPHLTCVNNTCVDSLAAAFNSEYANGVAAEEIRKDSANVPVLNFIMDSIVAPTIQAFSPSYYQAADTQARFMAELIKNTDNNMENYNYAPPAAKVKMHINVIKEKFDETKRESFGSQAYLFLAQTSLFTSAYTQNFGAMFNPNYANNQNNAFLNYAATSADPEATEMQRLAAASGFGLEITFVAADFLDVVPAEQMLVKAGEKLQTKAIKKGLDLSDNTFRAIARQKGGLTYIAGQVLTTPTTIHRFFEPANQQLSRFFMSVILFPFTAGPSNVAAARLATESLIEGSENLIQKAPSWAERIPIIGGVFKKARLIKNLPNLPLAKLKSLDAELLAIAPTAQTISIDPQKLVSFAKQNQGKPTQEIVEALIRNHNISETQTLLKAIGEYKLCLELLNFAERFGIDESAFLTAYKQLAQSNVPLSPQAAKKILIDAGLEEVQATKALSGLILEGSTLINPKLKTSALAEIVLPPAAVAPATAVTTKNIPYNARLHYNRVKLLESQPLPKDVDPRFIERRLEAIKRYIRNVENANIDKNLKEDLLARLKKLQATAKATLAPPATVANVAAIPAPPAAVAPAPAKAVPAPAKPSLLQRLNNWWQNNINNGPVGDFLFGRPVIENLDSPPRPKLRQQAADWWQKTTKDIKDKLKPKPKNPKNLAKIDDRIATPITMSSGKFKNFQTTSSPKHPIQDAVHITSKGGAWAVADGVSAVGRNTFGKLIIAKKSRKVAEEVSQFLAAQLERLTKELQINHNNISTTLPNIQRQLNQLLKEKSFQLAEKYKGMGAATITASTITPDGVLITVHVGDCETRIVRNGKIYYVGTLQHSNGSSINQGSFMRLINQQGDPVQAIQNMPNNIGGNPTLFREPFVTAVALQPGDIILSSSDGIHKVLTDNAILEIITKYKGDLQKAEEKLIQAALNQNNGIPKDDFGLLLVRYGNKPTPTSLWGKIANLLGNFTFAGLNLHRIINWPNSDESAKSTETRKVFELVNLNKIYRSLAGKDPAQSDNVPDSAPTEPDQKDQTPPFKKQVAELTPETAPSKEVEAALFLQQIIKEYESLSEQDIINFIKNSPPNKFTSSNIQVYNSQDFNPNNPRSPNPFEINTWKMYMMARISQSPYKDQFKNIEVYLDVAGGTFGNYIKSYSKPAHYQSIQCMAWNILLESIPGISLPNISSQSELGKTAAGIKEIINKKDPKFLIRKFDDSSNYQRLDVDENVVYRFNSFNFEPEAMPQAGDAFFYFDNSEPNDPGHTGNILKVYKTNQGYVFLVSESNSPKGEINGQPEIYLVTEEGFKEKISQNLNEVIFYRSRKKDPLDAYYDVPVQTVEELPKSLRNLLNQSPPQIDKLLNHQIYLQKNNQVVINTSGNTMAELGCTLATTFNILDITGHNPDINKIIADFPWMCSQNGCQAGAQTVLTILKQNGFTEIDTLSRITDTQNLKNYTGILIYEGTTTLNNKSIAHAAGFVCEQGYCLSIDSNFSDGNPVPCEINKNYIKCGQTTYHVGTTKGIPDALYPVTTNLASINF